MRIIRRPAEIQDRIQRAKGRGRSIGFVPTMGALHEGHLSLIRQARKETDCVVVSIFVNPMQFNQRSDFRSYPRPLAKDAVLCARAGAHLLFVPSARVMVPPGFQTMVEVAELSRPWEGRFRPNHFRGVATVVTQLFHLVQPDVAYFGRKDAQQARIVEQLIRDLHFPTRLRVMPIVREASGLALSSRNSRLSPDARRRAAALFAALQEGRRLLEWRYRRTEPVLRRMRRILQQTPGCRLEYLAAVDPSTLKTVRHIHGPVLLLIAAWLDSVRLIDCLEVEDVAVHAQVQDPPGHGHRGQPRIRRIDHH